MSEKKSMIVRESKVFPAEKEIIFELLQSVETLQIITSPFIAFEPVEKEQEMIWQVGKRFKFKAKLCGFIPFGIHTIKLLEFDKDKGIYSNETNTYVPVWNHRILLNDLADGQTEYWDIVEIYAGWKTIFVYIWAKLFYQHRQRKWVKILKALAKDKG